MKSLMLTVYNIWSLKSIWCRQVADPVFLLPACLSYLELSTFGLYTVISKMFLFGEKYSKQFKNECKIIIICSGSYLGFGFKWYRLLKDSVKTKVLPRLFSNSCDVELALKPPWNTTKNVAFYKSSLYWTYQYESRSRTWTLCSKMVPHSLLWQLLTGCIHQNSLYRLSQASAFLGPQCIYTRVLQPTSSGCAEWLPVGSPHT